MDDKQLKSKLRETFDTEVPDVLSKIKANPKFLLPQKTGFSLKSLLNRKLFVTFSSIFVLALILAVGFTRNNYVVASTVTLELNPSIEISLNRNDFVIKVTALNDDGDAIIEKDVNYRGLTIDRTLEIVLKRLNELGYVVDSEDLNNIILIDVESRNSKIKERIKKAFEVKLEDELGKYNQSHWVFGLDDIDLTDDQLRMIRNNDLLKKMSISKLALIYRINALDSSNTHQDLAMMSVRDLYDLYISLEIPENLPERNRMPNPRFNHRQP